MILKRNLSKLLIFQKKIRLLKMLSWKSH